MTIPKSIYIAWLRLAWFMRKNFGVKTYGLGWTASKVGKPFDFDFKGISFRFLPSAARSYCLLPAGIPNEPETHQFLERVLTFIPPPVTFIDVGASIGEFAIPMTHDPRVKHVFAFEPNPKTAEALRLFAAKAPSGKITVIQKAVGSSAGTAIFDLNDMAPTNAGLRGEQTKGNQLKVEVGTLDEECPVETATPLIILIDIEGGELDALKGAKHLIENHKPLIIFEYNDTTKRSFKLSDAIDFLGDSYSIYRLRSEDGKLDRDLTTTWNVVALPSRGAWGGFVQTPGLFAT